IQRVLPTGPAAAGALKVSSQGMHHRIEDIHRSHIEAPTRLGENGPERIVHHRVEHWPWVSLDFRNRLVELAPRSHEGPNVFDRLGFLELYETGSRHRVHRFPRGVGNQMQMMLFFLVLHTRPAFHPMSSG